MSNVRHFLDSAATKLGLKFEGGENAAAVLLNPRLVTDDN